MELELMNLGFIKIEENIYFNEEVQVKVKILDDEHIAVATTKGAIKATIAELEDAIIGGGLGDF